MKSPVVELWQATRRFEAVLVTWLGAQPDAPAATPPAALIRDALLSVQPEFMPTSTALPTPGETLLPVSGLIRRLPRLRLDPGPAAGGQACALYPHLPTLDAQGGDYLWVLLPAQDARMVLSGQERHLLPAEAVHLSGSELARAYLASLPGLGGDRQVQLLAQLGEQPLARLCDRQDLPAALTAHPAFTEDTSLLPGLRLAEFAALLTRGYPRALARHLAASVPGAGGAGHRDPYRLYPQLSFAECDEAAKRLGLTPGHPTRSAALAAELLTRAIRESGHSHLPARELQGQLQARSLLDHEARPAVQLAHELGFLVLDEERAYSHAGLKVERALAEVIRERLNTHVTPFTWAPGGRLNREQAQAVTQVGASSLSVLTGGPGTGKSTTLKALCDCAEGSRLRVMLCAPTGKAASRMTETTGRPASTIHRLLEMTPRGWKFYKGHPLPVDLLVVDESSMIPDHLLLSLLRAVPAGARVLLVGDSDQLPPIEAGAPFAALDGLIPTTRLTRVYRQAAGSRILDVALALLTGDEDFDWPSEVTGASSADEIARVAVRERLLLLTPMRSGPFGAEALNAAMQRALGRKGGVEVGTARLYTGDPVIQTRNDYTRGVFNGAVGVVTETTGSGLTVEFDSGPQTYQGAAMHALLPAHAVTIHRAQGSEWERVGVVLHDSHKGMLTRTLAYTAVTRAKKELTLFGAPALWDIASARRAPHRHSHLAERVTA